MPTNAWGPDYVGHADGTCTSDTDCTDHRKDGNPDTHCAKITDIDIVIPLNGQFRAVRMYSAGPGRTDLHQNTPCDDIQWARWLHPMRFTDNEGRTVVRCRFKNWSGDQNRYVRVEVDWESIPQVLVYADAPKSRRTQKPKPKPKPKPRKRK